jgi:hypothetical protein
MKMSLAGPNTTWQQWSDTVALPPKTTHPSQEWCIVEHLPTFQHDPREYLASKGDAADMGCTADFT